MTLERKLHLITVVALVVALVFTLLSSSACHAQVFDRDLARLDQMNENLSAQWDRLDALDIQRQRLKVELERLEMDRARAAKSQRILQNGSYEYRSR